jgi:hypothetical protein
MNAGPDVERRISDYLAEQSPTRAPDRILPATFEQTRHERQRRFGAAWRSISMNRTWQLATAAVVGLLIIGLGAVFIVGRQAGVGGGPASTPSPSPSPTPAFVPASGPIAAGTYLVSDGKSEFSVTFPAGWDASEGRDFRKHRDEAGELVFAIYDHDISVYPDACANDVTPPLTGPTPADLVAALNAQVNSDVSAPTDLTIGGRPGQRLEIAVPQGLDMTTCYESSVRIWTGPSGGNYLAFGPPSGAATINIVESPTGRTVLDWRNNPAATDADNAELDAIVASIRFEP